MFQIELLCLLMTGANSCTARLPIIVFSERELEEFSNSTSNEPLPSHSTPEDASGKPFASEEKYDQEKAPTVGTEQHDQGIADVNPRSTRQGQNTDAAEHQDEGRTDVDLRSIRLDQITDTESHGTVSSETTTYSFPQNDYLGGAIFSWPKYQHLLCNLSTFQNQTFNLELLRISGALPN